MLTSLFAVAGSMMGVFHATVPANLNALAAPKLHPGTHVAAIAPSAVLPGYGLLQGFDPIVAVPTTVASAASFTVNVSVNYSGASLSDVSVTLFDQSVISLIRQMNGAIRSSITLNFSSTEVQNHTVKPVSVGLYAGQGSINWAVSVSIPPQPKTLIPSTVVGDSGGPGGPSLRSQHAQPLSRRSKH